MPAILCDAHRRSGSPGIPYKRVVVQPHLLFQGELVTKVRRQVDGFGTGVAGIEWIVSQHLGPSQLIARAVQDRLCGVQ